MSAKYSEQVAFDAMRRYVEEFCKPLGGDDELGYLLSAITNFLWADGMPNVRSEWEDYLVVLEQVTSQSSLSMSQSPAIYRLDEKEAFRSMLTFLDSHYRRKGPRTMIRPILDELNALRPAEFETWSRWSEWLDAVETVKRGEGAR
jgi:hypothetical protein